MQTEPKYTYRDDFLVIFTSKGGFTKSPGALKQFFQDQYHNQIKLISISDTHCKRCYNLKTYFLSKIFEMPETKCRCFFHLHCLTHFHVHSALSLSDGEMECHDRFCSISVMPHFLKSKQKIIVLNLRLQIFIIFAIRGIVFFKLNS